MKILSASQIKEADRYTIDSEPISSLDLMERAAGACVQSIIKRHQGLRDFIVICGKGNNGGDGLAIARLLAAMEYRVQVFVLEYTDSASDDFMQNMERLKAQGKANITHAYTDEDIYLNKESALIDAILGTGINKPTDGLIASVIDKVNKSGNRPIAIDVPSGMSIDGPSAKRTSIIHASLTLTFQQPKLAFMFPESAEYVGEFEVLDIHLDTSFLKDTECKYFYMRDSDIAPMLRTRPKFSHKGTFGHSLLIAGSYGKMGAAVLSSMACLRSGTGLLTTHIPVCGYQVMQTSLPEAMVSIDTGTEHISAMPADGNYASIGIGPGIGTEAATVKILKKIIQSVQVPMVIDADALNIIGDNKTWIGFLPALTILTPHPKEYDRLTNVHPDSWERLESARALAQKHRIIIVLKGAYTAVTLPDGSVWFNSTGNPGLAKGGSGDVLTGIITALIARGYGPHIACTIGVYLHGLAADIAAREINAEAMIASDIVSHLSAAFDHLYGYQQRTK
ncbi:MAG: carbohydrate kinase, YjeF related protein [Bacteroidetes bacterium]|nr:carbohydrate kinase, YjeF related protein [Bacteroidota bacterium]